jgi:carbon monoxide dehydrogenase subunit G
MARYRAEIETRLPPEQVFAYLSDFSHSEDWDPSVVSAERLGPVGEGTEFHLVASFLGRNVPLTYRATEFEPPHSVLFVGENTTAVSRDRITVEGQPEGSRVTYDADLRLKGPLRVLDPLLGLAFKRVGDRALASLRQLLDGPLPTDLDMAA